jgi:hypothetical protein
MPPNSSQQPRRAAKLLGAAVCFVLTAGCDVQTDIYGRAATLYRSSVSDELARYHIATFDATENAQYNWENCQIARELFLAQPGVKVRYWCEKGRYRE